MPPELDWTRAFLVSLGLFPLLFVPAPEIVMEAPGLLGATAIVRLVYSTTCGGLGGLFTGKGHQLLNCSGRHDY